jgi:long-chain acyl-CoA synthetase
MPNLATLLTETAQRHAQRPALKLGDSTVSYEALDEGSARVAGLLRQRGVGAGDRVGIMLPNVPYFAIAYYGVLRTGGVVVPMNVLLKGREVQFYPRIPR